MLLYKLDDALRKIEEALHKNDKELADIYVKRYLNCKNSRFAKRVDRVCQLIQELKARHDARREEAERLRELATRDWSNLCDLKQSLCQVIKHDLHLECYETEHFHLTVRPCSDEPRITWPQAPWEWPAEFVIERDGQKELDIAALRQALLEGREIEGCAILPLQYELVIE